MTLKIESDTHDEKERDAIKEFMEHCKRNHGNGERLLSVLYKCKELAQMVKLK